MTRPAFTLMFAGLAPFAFAQGPDFVAPPGETVWNTDFTQVVTTTGPINVTGGVFVFHAFTIPAGATLRGIGSRPMLVIANDVQIDGKLTVDGGDGNQVVTLHSAQFPTLGGRGGAAGGNGGVGSPHGTMQSLAAQAGYGPGNAPGLGGGGGILSLLIGCGRGSGGGGGSFATIGDPWYQTPAGIGNSFVQRRGIGGLGCTGASGSSTRTLIPGGPGGVMFVDARPDNDFFGLGYDFASNTVVAGELANLVGGAGGGGGGDLSNDSLLLSPNWANDSTGGGGGGGGGCLLVAALANLVVGPTGFISANGGNGGGGEQAGSCNEGGGGGAGSGGLLILAAQGQIELHVKGETYANSDYDFVLSADGGVCKTGAFQPPFVARKYPANGQPTISGASYDAAPLGGFGGMGVVELVTHAGNNTDGTNTRLDDNIVLVRNGVTLSGAQKQRFLAWRGFRNGGGVFVDDFGAPTNIGANEGDIRPAPVLLPIF